MKMHRPGKTFAYILKRDRNSENQTEFTLRPLTWKEMDEVNQFSAMSLNDALKIHEIYKRAADEDRKLTDEEKSRIDEIAPEDQAMISRLHQQHAKACEFGVKSIGMVFDDQGIGFHPDTNEFITNAPGSVITELGGEIISISRFSEAQLKN